MTNLCRRAVDRLRQRDPEFDALRRALRAAAGLECLHTYSLVHDDLPCMDDDELRRGRVAEHNRSVPPPQTWGTVLADVEAEYRRAQEAR